MYEPWVMDIDLSAIYLGISGDPDHPNVPKAQSSARFQVNKNKLALQ
jgi:hypothetical protein